MANPTPQTTLKDALYQISTEGIAVDDITPLYPIRNFIRRQYSGEFRWSYRSKVVPLVPVLTSGVYISPVPTTMDDRFPVVIYDIYNGQRRNFKRVEYGELFAVSSTALFYQDRVSGTVITNTGGGFIDYQVQVTDLPESSASDLNPDVFPDTTAISYGIAGAYVNSVETADELGKTSYFEGKYSAQLSADIARESAFLTIIDTSYQMKGRR